MAKKKARVDLALDSADSRASPFAALASMRSELPKAADLEPDVEPDAESPSPEAQASSEERPLLQGQRVIVRCERGGRRGKTVTFLEGFDISPSKLQSLQTLLKKKLGCGAKIEDRALVLLGDLEKRIEPALREAGAAEIIFATLVK